jgi:hypothetical protein
MESISDVLFAPTTLAVLAWLGLAGTFVVGYVFYRKAKPNGRLSFVWNTVTLTSGRSKLPEEVEIVYRGQTVPRVAQTAMIIWNSGNTILDRAAFVDRDPLRLTFGKDVTVLQVQVLESTRDVVEFTANVSKDKPEDILLSFDFLEPEDGARLAVLHTGDATRPGGLGTLKGVRRGLINAGKFDTSDTVASSRWQIFGFFLVVSLIAAPGFFALLLAISPETAASLLPGLIKLKSTSDSASETDWLAITTSLYSFALIVFLFFRARRVFPKKFIAPRPSSFWDIG